MVVNHLRRRYWIRQFFKATHHTASATRIRIGLVKARSSSANIVLNNRTSNSEITRNIRLQSGFNTHIHHLGDIVILSSNIQNSSWCLLYTFDKVPAHRRWIHFVAAIYQSTRVATDF